METKKWYQSKSVWLNVVAGVAGIVQSYTGFVISVEAQAAILIVLNLILRAVTRSEITW